VHPPPRTSNKGRQKCPSRDAVSPPVPVPTSPDPQPSPAGVLSGSPSAHGVARPGSGGGGGGGGAGGSSAHRRGSPRGPLIEAVGVRLRIGDTSPNLSPLVDRRGASAAVPAGTAATAKARKGSSREEGATLRAENSYRWIERWVEGVLDYMAAAEANPALSALSSVHGAADDASGTGGSSRRRSGGTNSSSSRRLSYRAGAVERSFGTPYSVSKAVAPASMACAAGAPAAPDETVDAESGNTARVRAREISERGTLNCEIPPDPECLQLIHERYRWTPSQDMIRASPAVQQLKQEHVAKTLRRYCGVPDQILHDVFGCGVVQQPNGRYAASVSEAMAGRKRLARHPFPYDLPHGTRHYVLWYLAETIPVEREQVTADIAESIEQLIGAHHSFEFAWYENPKMTVPELYHVQVFWRKSGRKDSTSRTKEPSGNPPPQ